MRVLLYKLESVLQAKIPGAIVEFGCYIGTTSLCIERLLSQIDPTRSFHVYDSFEGLPEKSTYDESSAGIDFKEGQLATSKKEFVTTFKKANLRLPMVHKGWFSALQPTDIPDQIAFAFLDGDYYESIYRPLEHIWPRLSSGAVVIIDDYQNDALPGASKAVDNWLKTHPVASFRIEASLAMMVLPVM